MATSWTLTISGQKGRCSRNSKETCHLEFVIQPSTHELIIQDNVGFQLLIVDELILALS